MKLFISYAVSTGFGSCVLTIPNEKIESIHEVNYIQELIIKELGYDKAIVINMIKLPIE